MNSKEIRKKIEFYRNVTVQHNLIGTDTLYPEKCAFFNPEKIKKHWRLFLENKKKPYLSMYVNIPYCASRCNFCMYNSKTLAGETELEEYIDYLSEAISFFAPVFEGRTFSTLHIGGGTPNLLKNSLLERLLEEINSRFDFLENGSRTIEITTTGITEEQLDTAMENGINRVSLGVQSLAPGPMKLANRRVVGIERIKELVEHLRKRGLQELNVDLMGGLPGDRPEDFEKSFLEIARLGVSTINIYFLRLENTRYPAKIIREHSGLKLEEFILELLDAIAPAAEKYRYRNSSDDPFVVCQKFYHEDFPYTLIPHATSWDPELQNSCLGLGVNARSHIFDRATFTDAGPGGAGTHDISKALSGDLDFSKTRFRVHVFRGIDRMRNFVLKELYKNGRVGFRDFKKLFRKDIMDIFGEEIGLLERLGKIKIEKDSFSMLVSGVLERAVYMKFFYDQRALEELAGSKPMNYFVTS